MTSADLLCSACCCQQDPCSLGDEEVASCLSYPDKGKKMSGDN